MTTPNLKPKVTIVIPTYNHAPFLKQALASVVNQDFADWEAIVINNFSEDNTIQVVNSFQDPRIRLVNFRNNGCIAASRNEGVRLASSEYVAFLDSDDLWYPSKLSTCLAQFTPEVSLVCHGLRFMFHGQLWKDVKYGPDNAVSYRSLLFKGNGFPPTALIVRKACLDKVGGFSENPDFITAEDYELLLKLARENFKFRFIQDVLGEYQWHSGNSSNSVLRQMNATLAVVTYHYENHLELESFDALWLRRRRALIYCGFARTFQRNRQKPEAWQLFLRSLRTFPFFLKIYAAIVLFCLSLLDKRFDK
ncbi:MAG TPA: glycosyltransferase [Bacillota bacterium]|nr:glycosyltransferase [Bacillota bacterium]